MHSAVCRRVRCGPSCSSPTAWWSSSTGTSLWPSIWPPGHPRHRHDHLGHGGSIRTRADYGYFAQPDGNRAVLDDLHAVTALTKQLYPGVPYFLLGHSMGSFYARQYLCEWGDELDGAIIMGTGFQPKALVATARTLCRVLAVFFGWEHRSKLVANLSFLGYNRGLEGRTPQDWLNRDQAEVDKYRADERCMFTFTLNAYYSMFTGILRLYRPRRSWPGSPKDPAPFSSSPVTPTLWASAPPESGGPSRASGTPVSGTSSRNSTPAPATSCWWRRTKPRCLRTSPAGSKNNCIFESKAPSSS